MTPFQIVFRFYALSLCGVVVRRCRMLVLVCDACIALQEGQGGGGGNDAPSTSPPVAALSDRREDDTDSALGGSGSGSGSFGSGLRSPIPLPPQLSPTTGGGRTPTTTPPPPPKATATAALAPPASAEAVPAAPAADREGGGRSRAAVAGTGVVAMKELGTTSSTTDNVGGAKALVVGRTGSGPGLGSERLLPRARLELVCSACAIRG